MNDIYKIARTKANETWKASRKNLEQYYGKDVDYSIVQGSKSVFISNYTKGFADGIKYALETMKEREGEG